jgi:signal transduction histidine kinase
MSDLAELVGRLQKQQSAIVRLSRRHAQGTNLTETLSAVVIEAAETLNVERVGVWILSEDRQQLRCLRSYRLSNQSLGSGELLRAVDYPVYFAALETGRGIDAHDAREDPRTLEFRDDYLVPLSITSMLDAAIRDEGRVIGVVCHEHVGEPRRWTPDELAFAGATADQVAMALAAAERHRNAAERDRMQKHVLHAQKLESLGVLAGGIAHDFNNLLVGILTNAQYAREQLAPEHPARAAIDDVVAAAQRTAGLTQQLLVYSGRAPSVSQPTRLAEQVRELAHLLESGIPKHVRLHLDLSDELPAIEADVAQLQQVIMNVILNGAEAIGAGGGTVRVTATVAELSAGDLQRMVIGRSARPGPHVVIEIADTGHGIDVADLERIFDPFYTTKGPGRGLGLASVLGVIQTHRGALAVSSGPRGGTTFRLYFPVATNAPVDAEPSAAPHADARGTILIIDDEKAVRAATARVLAAHGHDVLVAQGGREGLDILRSRLADIRLVILDLTMPHMSGGETFFELRRLRADLPVLFVSGSNDGEELTSLLRQERVRFLAKPFGIDRLCAEVAAAVQ